MGDLLQEYVVTKLADDVYCAGNTLQELQYNWERVLQVFAKCELHLSPAKTIIVPHSAIILGWIWSQGIFRSSPDHILTLSACSAFSTVRGLRSFIGAYKALAKVLP